MLLLRQLRLPLLPLRGCPGELGLSQPGSPGNVLSEQHKHVTMRTVRGVSHRQKPASWLFRENRPLRMCKLGSCFGGISPHQSGLKLSELDKWAREWLRPMVPGWPHAVPWQRMTWLRGSSDCGRVISERQNDRTGPQTLSTRLEAVKPIAQAHQ
ncbi:unnamed protein product [Pleuronectes platessa]|uniref:Uncharacterized protein n=1 Tax=Pleuronectes platessa TaxID=8262 RepID=A0A9N7V1Q1_PLEPL|nr:unnamed protein product [Pleuronectes platessa]